MPAPIAPALTPKPPRPLSKSLPKFTPAHGLTHPSARAAVGAHTSTTVAESTIALIKPRISFAPLRAVEAPPDKHHCKRYARNSRRALHAKLAIRFFGLLSVRAN